MIVKLTKRYLLPAAVVVFGAVAISAQGQKGKSAVASPEQIKHGQYLVMVGGCNDCHSPKVFTKMGPVPDSTRLLSGHPHDEQLPPVPFQLLTPDQWGGITNNNMTAWAGMWGVSFAANLTPDNETGSGAWTEEAFIKAMRTGKHLGTGREILPPMPWPTIGQMTDQDLRDLFAYMKSLKPIKNMVPQPIPPKQN